ncbi:lysophospholipid acyltransferase family protein [Spartinivicinus poritis]|uniref:Lysophospholipid acyltransferase family protein n=1 Tax=Spartinivicinus poritis TaxID=2994640 RepID=A0ABT5UBL4_9GAMM|nr:lysophospholipid acyltransferase family protein [Spartinivicinus sp. A2-2]MDE1463762.1 lysophospholipid acyltransferase family protein [Spartinivicinus sp. A2-2]
MLRMIKTGLFYSLLSTWTMFWFIFCCVSLPILPANRRHRVIVKPWCHTALFLSKHLCGVQYQVIGAENIPDSAGVIISNHQSTWETFFLQTIFSPQTQVIKRELLSIPFFGWTFRLLNPIAINRKDVRGSLKTIISKGTTLLQKGNWVLIFPEGTRKPYGKLGKYSSGGAALAINAAKQVVPVAHNAGKIWPSHQWLKNPGTITVVIGKPIDTSDKNHKQLSNELHAWTEQQLANIDN